MRTGSGTIRQANCTMRNFRLGRGAGAALGSTCQEAMRTGPGGSSKVSFSARIARPSVLRSTA
jgi:hypothetical protein